jgi:hypothetical protein
MTRRFALRATAVAALAILALAGAAAQSSSPADDPFAAGAFDEATGAAAAVSGGSGPSGSGSSAVAKTEYLVGGTFLVSASSWFGPGIDGYAALSSASGKAFAKVSDSRSGTLYAAASVRQVFFKALSGDDLAALGRAESLSDPTVDLAEFHYSFDIGKKAFFRLGKQLLAWGPSVVWTPVDFVNAEKADFFAAFDAREGKSGLKLLVPFKSANVLLFTDFSGLVDSGDAVARDPADRGAFAGRVDATFAGFEFGLTGYGGPARQPKGGLDFSGHLLGLAAYGELAAAPEAAGKDASVQASLGFSRLLGDLKKWTVSGEGFYNSTGERLTGDELAFAVVSGDASPLYVGKFYAYGALKGTDLLFTGHDATVSVTANLSDDSFQARLAQDFDIPKAPPFTLIAAYSGGGEDKEFTWASGNNSFELTLRARVDF